MGFRVASFIPGVALLTRAARNGLDEAIEVTDDVGTILNKGGQWEWSLKNLFRPFEKVYDMGKGTLRVTGAKTWSFARNGIKYVDD